MRVRKLAKLFRFWLPVVLWMGLIFWLSSMPTLPSTVIIWWDVVMKKTAHVLVYAGLMFWWVRALAQTRLSLHQSLRWAFVFTFLYAISDEWHQSFVMGRTAAWYDVGFDTIGALLARGLILRYELVQHWLFDGF